MPRRAIWLDDVERDLLRRALAHVADEARPRHYKDGTPMDDKVVVYSRQWTRDSIGRLLARFQEPGRDSPDPA